MTGMVFTSITGPTPKKPPLTDRRLMLTYLYTILEPLLGQKCLPIPLSVLRRSLEKTDRMFCLK